MNMCQVSILVPVYNAEAFIERCARSLFGQTYRQLEFVFVDDCSTDGSVGVLTKVADDYPDRKGQIIVIHHERNRGAAATKNTALSQAKGEFVCFVDADDWMELDAVETLVERQFETGADVVWGGMDIHSEEGVAKLEEPVYNDCQQWILACINDNTDGAVTSNSRRIVRRSLFTSHGIQMSEGCNYGEDRLLMCQIAYFAQGFSVVDKTVYHYDKSNADSLSGEGHLKKHFAEIVSQKNENLRLLEVFFSDKESLYYEESVKSRMLYLRQSMNEALHLSSRKGFHAAVRCINRSNPSAWKVIEWNKGWIWRKLHSSYFYRKKLPILKSALNRK